MTDYSAIMAADIALIEAELERLLSAEAFAGRESAGLDVMRQAMSYSLRNGGKRIRPVLALEFCRLFGGRDEAVINSACALEMIHTYSLIHDDLPCMDDDDLRRGKPSNHIVFGYANALLAGDALLTLAFETVLGGCADNAAKVEAGLILAKAAGASGMIAGQVCDLANEQKNASLDEIKTTDRLKTCELIRAAGALGCCAAGADEASRKAAHRYCADIGLAFQIVDDILDVTSTSSVLGKPVGSDEQNSKSTYVSLLGIERSRQLASELTASAKAAVAGRQGSEFLVWLADYLCGRVF